MLIVFLYGFPTAFAADNNTRPEIHREFFSTTKHSIKINGKKIIYTATAGQLILKDEKGHEKAVMFFMAYEKEDENRTKRPVTFAFNGGPGSSSVWLHFGAMGPKRVFLKEDGTPPAPQAILTNNEYTWLSFTDLVFIDPVGTGYSRVVDKKFEKQFYGVKKDVESVGDLIRLYLTRYNRWLSPKFVVGESYGTTRAVGITEYLHNTHGIDLNGIVLISPVLKFKTILFDRSNDLPYIMFLPSYTATAWHHKKIPVDVSLEDILEKVENWALGDYITCLAKGNSLNKDQEKFVAKQISAYTGISADYILENNLKVPATRFRKELMRSSRRVVGRMDSRFTGPTTDPAGQQSTYDPSLEMLVGTFSSAINHYIRNDLKFKEDIPYRYLNYNAGRSWNWRSGMNSSQGYVDVCYMLTEAMQTNRYLRVFIASGYYDLATPYFAAKYTLSHLQLKPLLRRNSTPHVYKAGHMMYINKPSLENLSRDISLFYTQRPNISK